MPKDLSRYIMEFVSNKSAKLVTEQEIAVFSDPHTSWFTEQLYKNLTRKRMGDWNYNPNKIWRGEKR